MFQIKPLFDKAESKNKLLRSVAGGGVDSINTLLARWDKFELMMESHQLMVKEQVRVLYTNIYVPTTVVRNIDLPFFRCPDQKYLSCVTQ